MPRLSRRRVLGGLAATAPASLIPHRALGQGAGPSSQAEIDLAKAKAEGKVMLYTSLDTKIVDAVIKPFNDKYGIDVQYYRGGSNDVTSKVLAEADAGRLQVDVVDASDLAAILGKKKRDDFVRCLSEKLLTYALGRGLERYDRCAIDEIGRSVAKKGYRFSSLVQAIAKSVPFQQRRGETEKSTQTAAARVGGQD